MKCETIQLNATSLGEGVATLRHQLRALGLGLPSFSSVHISTDHPGAVLPFTLGGGALHVATSCQVVATQDGPAEAAGSVSVAAFVLWDDEGDYGTASLPLATAPKEAAANAVKLALERAGRLGEAPNLIWVSPTPGQEEAVLQGIEQVVGTKVPVVGGSAADATISGAWWVGDGTVNHAAGVTVSVLFPSRPISVAYQNGYAPTGQSGSVTKATGRRVFEIDGTPAAQVYADWTDGALCTTLPATETGILAESTLWPLGRKATDIADVPVYLLSHPSAHSPEGALDFFTDIAVGDVLHQMTGSADGLVTRAGRVATMARDGLPQGSAPTGALMVYCGGCMLAVRDRVDDITDGVRTALAEVPFLTTFTFGEQGPVPGLGNRHGNLMIVCIVFGT